MRTSQLEQVQRRAARWTASNYDWQASATQIVQDLGWRTLEQRRADARLCLFYKVIHGLVAVPLPDYIQYSSRISRYCHSMTFRQVSTSRDYYKYSFFPLAIVQWNALPQPIACLQYQPDKSASVFKASWITEFRLCFHKCFHIFSTILAISTFLETDSCRTRSNRMMAVSFLRYYMCL